MAVSPKSLLNLCDPFGSRYGPSINRAGRPRMREGKPRARKLCIRLMPHEYEALAGYAARENQTISEYVREQLRIRFR